MCGSVSAGPAVMLYYLSSPVITIEMWSSVWVNISKLMITTAIVILNLTSFVCNSVISTACLSCLLLSSSFKPTADK